ncbi:energy-coupling factor transporter ATPase [Evansella tamaricis]|uniref:Energy-coupling factor transporter ATP-binding protein EcfA2 n=1 Tax=Evansella tamaricis TaxID=2069301 RepID=A0ABS6JAR7_9BACI|nr:energy-coupling factor transporter ATPase [Evansella tamaricis]MBU9710776.1 energy-coupling factor transporter ATPase [Evansella tamaricis]
MYMEAKNVKFTYMVGSPFEKTALQNINLTLEPNSYTVLIGHTGSGKSTLIQLFNGLLKPTDGSIQIGNREIKRDTKQKHLYDVRKDVGMVFQYPEHQLFHETILKDVAFGPMNFGMSQEEAEKRAKESLKLVGIEEGLYERSPFDLSGGQMRRVAIAGVLASNPKTLILDEPTAGLDPQGKEDIMELFYKWYEVSEERSIILVTHHMEDAAKYGDQLIVLEQGGIHLTGTPKEVFLQGDRLRKTGLSQPETVRLLESLKDKSKGHIDTLKFHLNETVDEIVSFLRKDQ